MLVHCQSLPTWETAIYRENSGWMGAGREVRMSTIMYQTQKNCLWNEINVVIAAAAIVPNKLLDFLVWINVMSQCLFCLHTNLDTICGPLHTQQCSAFALVTHSLASPPLPLYYFSCHVSQPVWTLSSSPMEKQGVKTSIWPMSHSR